MSVELNGWLSPSDTWPQHGRGDAERALAEARRRGWWLKPSRRGHSYGLLVCKRKSGDEAPDEEPCEFRIFSTARGDSSDTSRLILETLEDCEHEPDAQPAEEPALATYRTSAAEAHLARAEKLTEALRRMLDRRGPMGRCRELLEAAQCATGQAEEALFEEAIAAETAARATDEAGRALAHDAGMALDPYPPSDPELLAAPARDALDQAERTIGVAEGATADGLRQRIQAVRQQLDSYVATLTNQSP
jgi:hypothetical protein